MTNEECAHKNVNAFLLFRVAFNSRFYYPVLAILFLDLGLSLEQYSLLNVAWAASIVGLEVPSGVLADLWGRKKLVVLASVLMVVEMLIFSFAPAENIQLLFYLFFFNRLLSGAAEAAASGADEALTYDSLEKAGQKERWPDVLEKLGRLQSFAFFVAMVIGGAVYDPATFNTLGGWLGFQWNIQAEDVVRMPLYLTLLLSLVACYAAFSMTDKTQANEKVSFQKATQEILGAAKWILISPVAFFVIIAYICNDSVVRLFMTMTSQYYRVLDFPEAAFGIIGAVIGLAGAASPTAGKWLIKLGCPKKAFGALSIITLCFLTLLPLTTAKWSLIFALGLGFSMGITGFLVSHYLNEVAEAKKRATILSFKGLAGNLAYGGIGLFFAELLRRIKNDDPSLGENGTFMEAMSYLPWAFAAMIALAYLSSKLQKRFVTN